MKIETGYSLGRMGWAVGEVKCSFANRPGSMRSMVPQHFTLPDSITPSLRS